jgi:glycosyltransferase involved in cell wall biosynthesis
MTPADVDTVCGIVRRAYEHAGAVRGAVAAGVHEARDRLTVLVTTFNHEAFIAQALDGILAQQTAVPFEVVVIDDASTDATQRHRPRRARSPPDRVRTGLQRRSTRTPIAASARSGSAASSEYVALLDGDDYWTSRASWRGRSTALDERTGRGPSAHTTSRSSRRSRAQPSRRASNGPTVRRTLGIADLWARNFIAGARRSSGGRCCRRLPAWYDDARWGDWPLYLLWPSADRSPTSTR